MRTTELVNQTTISEQVERILRSQTFAGKNNLRKLLEVLAANMDSQTTLKPDCLVKELWPEETRTKGSADLAKEVSRLRSALDSYYADEGKADPIIVSLPNRSRPGQDGKPERRWIAAIPRCDAGAKTPVGLSPRYLTAIAAVTVLAVLAFVSILMLRGDDRPYSARLDDMAFVVMNKEGKELWRKSFPDGFWREYYEQGLGPRTWFGDLERTGHTEVLFLYHPAVSPHAHSTTLICYSARGQEEWHWTPGRDLPELGGTPSAYRTDGFGVLKAAPNERARRIVVASGHFVYYPYQIGVVDAHGKTISEYWHSGQINHFMLADLDSDGKQEIFASGISNGYRQATLVVLDPNRVFGASTETARPEIQFHGMGVAQERIRLLFPRSDLNAAISTYNDAIETAVEHGRVRVVVQECLKLPACRVAYEFDSNFHLLAVEAFDQFRSAHNEFYRNDKTPHSFSAEEEKKFQKVRCLVGCNSEFVPVDARSAP
jgi:hypothetical protein